MNLSDFLIYSVLTSLLECLVSTLTIQQYFSNLYQLKIATHILEYKNKDPNVKQISAVHDWTTLI